MIEAGEVSARRRALDRAAIRGALLAAHWFARHWLVVANAFFGSFLLAAVLAPLSLALGFNDFALALYDGLKITCHQMPSRSWSLFGEQLGFCHRNTAIFATVVLAGTVYALVRYRVRPLSWTLTLLFMLPMAVDGFTQLFGWRESTWELRVITGTLFSIGWVWCIYPWADLLMLRMDRQLHDELAAAGLPVTHS